MNLDLVLPAMAASPVAIKMFSFAFDIYKLESEPRLITKKANAEACATITKTQAEIRSNTLRNRADRRDYAERLFYQKSIETVVEKSIPYLEENATPEKINRDWMLYFLDKCKKVSDEDMQDMWARVLAGEANSPGKYSKRTLNFLETIESSEAIMFSNFMQFTFKINNTGNRFLPLIFDTGQAIFNKKKINFYNLTHLKSIGLINFGEINQFNLDFSKSKNSTSGKKHVLSMSYFSHLLEVKIGLSHKLILGKVSLTEIGENIALLCQAKENKKFFDYVIDKWKHDGHEIVILSDKQKLLQSPCKQSSIKSKKD